MFNISEYLKNSFTVYTNDFKQYAYQNKIILQGASVTSAFATKDLIEKQLNKSLLPLLKYLIDNIPIHMKYKRSMNIIKDTLWDFFVWATIIVMTFFILEYGVNRSILGLKSTVKSEDEFNKAQVNKSEMLHDPSYLKRRAEMIRNSKCYS